MVNILVLGGSTRPGSSSERAAVIAGAAAERMGATVEYFLSRDLILPIYDTETPERSEMAQKLVAAMRRADGIIVVSPGYHGSISGMIKNAMDYAEDLAKDERTYLTGIPFGTVAVAYGWQATVTVVQQLRQMAHSLRAWPAPLGVTINSTEMKLAPGADDERAVASLEAVVGQVVEFAQLRAGMAVA